MQEQRSSFKALIFFLLVLFFTAPTKQKNQINHTSWKGCLKKEPKEGCFAITTTKMPQASDTMVLHWTTDFMFLVEGWHVTSYLAFGGTALLVFAVAIFYRWLHRLYNRCIKALKPEKMSEPLLLNPSYDDDPKQCVTPSFSVFPSPPPLIHLFFFFWSPSCLLILNSGRGAVVG